MGGTWRMLTDADLGAGEAAEVALVPESAE